MCLKELSRENGEVFLGGTTVFDVGGSPRIAIVFYRLLNVAFLCIYRLMLSREIICTTLV